MSRSAWQIVIRYWVSIQHCGNGCCAHRLAGGQGLILRNRQRKWEEMPATSPVTLSGIHLLAWNIKHGCLIVRGQPGIRAKGFLSFICIRWSPTDRDFRLFAGFKEITLAGTGMECANLTWLLSVAWLGTYASVLGKSSWKILPAFTRINVCDAGILCRSSSIYFTKP